MRRPGAVLAVAAAFLVMPVTVMMPGPGFPPAFIDAMSGEAFAVQPDEMLPDAALEQRARQISAGLRCLVCQNQSIDDSDADLARDLRVLVRERLQAGDSDAAVTGFIVARYGEFVLLKPRFSAETLVLWGTPVALLLAGGAFALFSVLAARRRNDGASGLTAAEERAVERTLRDNGL